jgi:hypothetical protein
LVLPAPLSFPPIFRLISSGAVPLPDKNGGIIADKYLFVKHFFHVELDFGRLATENDR